MIRVFLAIISCTLAAGVAANPPDCGKPGKQLCRIQTGSATACSSKANLVAVHGPGTSGLTSRLASAIGSGKCVRLRRDSEVRLKDTAAFDGYAITPIWNDTVQVQPAGSRQTYHIAKFALWPSWADPER